MAAAAVDASNSIGGGTTTTKRAAEAIVPSDKRARTMNASAYQCSVCDQSIPSALAKKHFLESAHDDDHELFYVCVDCLPIGGLPVCWNDCCPHDQQEIVWGDTVYQYYTDADNIAHFLHTDCTVFCKKCEALLPDSDSVHHGEDKFCGNCADICRKCKGLIHLEEGVPNDSSLMIDDSYICESCADKLYPKLDDEVPASQPFPDDDDGNN
jgi:hypothetical protein